MKKAFVYYSKTGNGDYVANYLKTKDYGIIKLEPRHKLPKNLFGQMMLGGMLALFKHKAKLKTSRFDLSEYDEIVIGTPIWNGRASTPFNTFIAKNDLANKKLTVVAYSASGTAIKLEERIKRINKDIRFISLKNVLKNPEVNTDLEKI